MNGWHLANAAGEPRRVELIESYIELNPRNSCLGVQLMSFNMYFSIDSIYKFHQNTTSYHNLVLSLFLVYILNFDCSFYFYFLIDFGPIHWYVVLETYFVGFISLCPSFSLVPNFPLFLLNCDHLRCS